MTRQRLFELLEEARVVRRDKPLSVRLSDDEHARLFAVAEKQRIPAATLARLLIVAGVEDLEAT